MLKADKLRSCLKGRHCVAWYLLWPVRGDSMKAGCVCERRFFELCARMERVSLRSCWPHDSHTYSVLAGKMWACQMCLNKAYRVPPTTRVHFADFLRAPGKTASKAMATLTYLSETLWGTTLGAEEECEGVIKLGFSWCGQDVLPFKGLASMVASLERLFNQWNSEQTVCLVQTLVPRVVAEHRVLCFRDPSGSFHLEPLWMLRSPATGRHHVLPCKLDVEDFQFTSPTCVPRRDAAQVIFGGDAAAQRAAEVDTKRLVDRWLVWFKTESPQCHCARLDFLVAHVGPGQVEVWTVEVSECGSSLCSVEVHARNLASLRCALRNSDRVPALPKPLPRNNGYKS